MVRRIVKFKVGGVSLLLCVQLPPFLLLELAVFQLLFLLEKFFLLLANVALVLLASLLRKKGGSCDCKYSFFSEEYKDNECNQTTSSLSSF